MLAARCGKGSRDVLALAVDSVDRLHHVRPPHHHGARRQAAIPRLVGSHCRQFNFRRTVDVAKLALNLRSLVGRDAPLCLMRNRFSGLHRAPVTAVTLTPRHSRVYQFR
jgi:hypothetical protein